MKKLLIFATFLILSLSLVSSSTCYNQYNENPTYSSTVVQFSGNDYSNNNHVQFSGDEYNHLNNIQSDYECPPSQISRTNCNNIITVNRIYQYDEPTYRINRFERFDKFNMHQRGFMIMPYPYVQPPIQPIRTTDWHLRLFRGF